MSELISESDFFAECVYTIERKPDTINISGYDFDALTDLALDVYNEFCIKFEVINIAEDAAAMLVRMFQMLDELPIESTLIKNDNYPFKRIELVYGYLNTENNPVMLCVGKND